MTTHFVTPGLRTHEPDPGVAVFLEHADREPIGGKSYHILTSFPYPGSSHRTSQPIGQPQGSSGPN